MSKMITKEIMGNRLKELRAKKNKTILQVSKDTGIGESALRNYECGYRIPNFQNMLTIADYYGKTVDSIFFRSK